MGRGGLDLYSSDRGSDVAPQFRGGTAEEHL